MGFRVSVGQGFTQKAGNWESTKSGTSGQKRIATNDQGPGRYGRLASVPHVRLTGQLQRPKMRQTTGFKIEAAGVYEGSEAIRRICQCSGSCRFGLQLAFSRWLSEALLFMK